MVSKLTHLPNLPFPPNPPRKTFIICLLQQFKKGFFDLGFQSMSRRLGGERSHSCGGTTFKVCIDVGFVMELLSSFCLSFFTLLS